MKHVIAILFILLDIIVFAGVSWVTGDFSPSPTATPDVVPTIRIGVATPTLPPPGNLFSDIKRSP